MLQIVDLAACWETGMCEPITAFERVDGVPVWSPTQYQVAIATPPPGRIGNNEVFVLTFDPESRTVSEVRQLTETPEINFNDLFWASNGEQVYAPCSTPGIEANEYALCQADLTSAVEVIAVPLLPWNMRRVNLVGERWIVDRAAVLQEGFYRLRAYAPESAWVAVAQDGRSELRLVNIETQAQYPVQPVLSDRIYFMGWVP